MTALEDSRPRLSERMSAASRASAEPRPRYYIFSPDLRTNPSDFHFANKDEVLIDGRTAGRHERPVPDDSFPFTTGVPPLRGKPRLVVALEEEPLDLYGFGPYYVSSRARALLAGIDSDGFDFVECDTADRNGAPVPPYWMTNAVRVVDEFDEERSDFVTYAEANPQAPDRSNHSILVLNDIYMSPGLPASHHAFYLARYATAFLVDALLGDSWREAGLTGAILTPLQPPTEADLGAGKDYPDYLLFNNSPYWFRKGSKT